MLRGVRHRAGWLVYGLAAVMLAACRGGGSTATSPASTTTPHAAGVDTATVCRTFEGYSDTFTKHFAKDARARNGADFAADLTTLQASIGVALYDIRDPKIARELKIAKRAAATVLEDGYEAVSERTLRVNLLLLFGSQIAIKKSCHQATQSVSA
jgi:hypothetical protein